MHSALGTHGIAREVLPRAPWLEHALIAPAEPSPHFGNELAFEGAVGRKHGARVGVFGIEIGTDAPLQRRWILDRLLKVRGPEPRVVVGQTDAVMLDCYGPAFRHWRGWQLGCEQGVFWKAGGEYRNDAANGAG